MGQSILTTQEKLNSIARGLVPAGHELSYFLILLIFIISAIFTIYIILGVSSRKKLHGKSDKKYQSLIREFNLTIREMDLLDELAAFLGDPRKKYLLLTNRGTFSYALRHLSLVREIPESVEKSLEKKLGFSPVEHSYQMFSTADIAKGMAVAVRYGEGGFILCNSEGRATGRLSLRAVKGSVNLKQRSPVTLFAYTYRDLYCFETKVLSIDRDLFTVSEAEVVDLKSNSRKRELCLPVYVSLENLHDSEMETEIVRVIKGGAILRNPDKSIKKGDDIRIAFHPVNAKGYHLNGVVWRVSRNKKYIYTVFSHINWKKL